MSNNTSNDTLGDILNEAINPDHKWKREAIDLCFKNREVEAIKVLRYNTGFGLKESTEYVNKILELIKIKTETVYTLYNLDTVLIGEFKTPKDLYEYAWKHHYSKANSYVGSITKIVK